MVLPNLILKGDKSKSQHTNRARELPLTWRERPMSIQLTLIGLLIFLTALVAHGSYTSLRILSDNNENVLEYTDDIIPSLTTLASIYENIGRFRLKEAENILRSGAKANHNDIDLLGKQVSEHINKLEHLESNTPQETVEWQAFAATWTRYMERHALLVRFSQEKRNTDAAELFKVEMGAIFDEATRILSRAIESEQLEATERVSKAGEQYRTARTILLAGVSLGLIVCFCATAYAVWGVSRPLARLSRAMKRLAEGESDVELPSFGRRNEIGQIAEAVARFKLRAAERAAILQEARKAAEEAGEAKANFIASMSHEIRTPLNGVLGMAQSLFADDLLPGQHNKVGIILDSGSILMALLNDVLDMSKINAGKLDIAPIDGDLRLSIMGVVHLFRQAADDKGVALNVILDATIPSRLNFDPIRVQQCISNLLSNAIKFTPPGGQIDLHVTCAAEPSGIVVTATTTDTGIGMSPESIAKLFSAFAQADGSISRRFGGSGLGLIIARRLAQAMGGDIDVTSELGVGSCFRMKFTAAAAPLLPAISSATRDIAPPTTVVLSGARVLLVDDNAVNRQVVKLFLKPFGLDISEAANGKEALEKLASEVFDIVLLDIHMPVMDGCETIQSIRASDEAWSRVPTIALTADAMSGDKERYLAMGMTDYLSKPIDQRELLSKVTSVIAAQRASTAAGSEGASSRFDGLVWRSAG